MLIVYLKHIERYLESITTLHITQNHLTVKNISQLRTANTHTIR